MSKYLDDILMLLGLALIVAGVSMISVPGAFIVAGVGLIGLGLLIGLGAKHDPT